MNNLDNLKITYKTLKLIMENEHLKQDNSFKRVLNYISAKIADFVIEN